MDPSHTGEVYHTISKPVRAKMFEKGEAKKDSLVIEEDVLASTHHTPNDYIVSKCMFSVFVSSNKCDFTH